MRPENITRSLRRTITAVDTGIEPGAHASLDGPTVSLCYRPSR